MSFDYLDGATKQIIDCCQRMHGLGEDGRETAPILKWV